MRGGGGGTGVRGAVGAVGKSNSPVPALAHALIGWVEFAV